MLHLLNGDTIREQVDAVRQGGEALVWREMLTEGPVPGGLSGSDAWARRGAWLEAHRGIPRHGHLEEVASATKRVRDAGPEDEVVLWFEEDLFCQVNLLYLLTLHPGGDPPWSLVCPERALGEHAPTAFRGLLDGRAPVTPERLDLARRAWEAYASPDPRAVEALAKAGTPEWPALQRGLRLHLSRFPAPGTGLGAPEAALLGALKDGPLRFDALYAAFQRAPDLRALGFGDSQVATLLWDLARGGAPLVRLAGAPADMPRPWGRPPMWEVHLTEDGRRVLAGRADRADLAPPDRWLGGVHLHAAGPLWRWDARDTRLVRE